MSHKTSSSKTGAARTAGGKTSARLKRTAAKQRKQTEAVTQFEQLYLKAWQKTYEANRHGRSG